MTAINFQMIRQHLHCCGNRPIPVHLNDMATTNDTFSSWWWTGKKTNISSTFALEKMVRLRRESSFFQHFDHLKLAKNECRAPGIHCKSHEKFQHESAFLLTWNLFFAIKMNLTLPVVTYETFSHKSKQCFRKSKQCFQKSIKGSRLKIQHQTAPNTNCNDIAWIWI
jgi:hypothetical protein